MRTRNTWQLFRFSIEEEEGLFTIDRAMLSVTDIIELDKECYITKSLKQTKKDKPWFTNCQITSPKTPRFQER